MVIMCEECLKKRMESEPDPKKIFRTEHSYICQICGAYGPAARYIDWVEGEEPMFKPPLM